MIKQSKELPVLFTKFFVFGVKHSSKLDDRISHCCKTKQFTVRQLFVDNTLKFSKCCWIIQPRRLQSLPNQN